MNILNAVAGKHFNAEADETLQCRGQLTSGTRRMMKFQKAENDQNTRTPKLLNHKKAEAYEILERGGR